MRTLGRPTTETTKARRDTPLAIDIPEPAGTLEIGGQPMVAIPVEAWERIVEELEDQAGALRARAILDSPEAEYVPLEEAEKDWFDNRIKAVRKEKGVTQKELARRLGVSQSRVSRLEDPDHRPTVRMYERVAKALGIGVAELI